MLKANLEFTSNELKDLKTIQGKDRDDEKNELSLLKKEIAYLEAYSRRENLIVEGITEAVTDEGKFEDTASVLRTLMASALKIEDPESIEFQRVHRFGKKKLEGTRPIIARFLRYSDKQEILKCSRAFRDDNIRIYSDLPKSIQESRRRQMPRLKAAKEAGKTAYFLPSKPDLLYIDGKLSPK